MYDTHILVGSVRYYHSRKFKDMWKGQSCKIINNQYINYVWHSQTSRFSYILSQKKVQICVKRIERSKLQNNINVIK